MGGTFWVECYGPLRLEVGLLRVEVGLLGLEVGLEAAGGCAVMLFVVIEGVTNEFPVRV